MSDRRSFFRKLIGGSAAIAAGGSGAEAKPEPDYRISRINGVDWNIVWSGWKEEAGSEMIFGQWIAKHFLSAEFPRQFHGVYAGTNGWIDSYHFGDMFNNGWKQDLDAVTASYSRRERDARRALMFDKLIEFLKTSPLADHSQCWFCGGCERIKDPRYAHIPEITGVTWRRRGE